MSAVPSAGVSGPPPERPWLSISQAAEACGVSRQSIYRRLQAGEIAGATNESGPWRLPVDGLLAAGLHLTHPQVSAPVSGEVSADAVSDDEVSVPVSDEVSDALAERDGLLRADRDQWRQRALVAEALTEERAERVADLHRALALLEATTRATRHSPPSPPPEPAPTAATVLMAAAGTAEAAKTPIDDGRRDGGRWAPDEVDETYGAGSFAIALVTLAMFVLAAVVVAFWFDWFGVGDRLLRGMPATVAAGLLVALAVTAAAAALAYYQVPPR